MGRNLRKSPMIMALSVKLTVKTDESEELFVTITTCELSGVHTIISLDLYAGNQSIRQP